MRIVVIIPTYNESGAIGALLEEMLGVFKATPRHEWFALVVDARSPDGTAEIVQEKMKKHDNVHLIVEPERRGIATAYLTGIQYAIQILHADAFVEFDGDGQHDPRDIPRLAAELERGFDYVIGSRYVAGGHVPQEWAWYRKFLSRFGSLYARILLELPVHDVTSGFKVTRVEGFASQLPQRPEQLLSRQYAYKIHLLAAMLESGARVREVPITFRSRAHDASKSTWRDIVESLKVTARLRLRSIRSWRLLRVMTIGAFGFVIQTTIFEILGIRLNVVAPSTATLIGAECAILSNFFLNNRFSFRDIKHTNSLLQRLMRFHLVVSGSLITQWTCLFLAEHTTHDIVLIHVAYILGVMVGFIFNYTGYFFFVWRRT